MTCKHGLRVTGKDPVDKVALVDCVIVNSVSQCAVL